MLLRPEQINLIQDAIDELVVKIAEISDSSEEFAQALQFASDDLRYGGFIDVDLDDEDYEEDFVPEFNFEDFSDLDELGFRQEYEGNWEDDDAGE